MKPLSFVFVVILSSIVALNAGAQCKTGAPFDPAFRDALKNFNDYGRIHEDANDPNCVDEAMWALVHKLEHHMWEDADPSEDTGTRTNPREGAFSSWLDGYSVALIYAAALRMGAYGWNNRSLDQLLLTQPGKHDGLDRFFTHAGQPNNPEQGSTPCQKGTFNTCMDDHAGSAAGFAWMAAYKERRGSDFTDQRNSARDHIDDAFEAVCIWSGHRSTSLPLCDRDVAALRAGNAATVSVNQGQQQIPYGFGLMTSIASAWVALRETGQPYEFTDDQKTVAGGLFKEAQDHVTSSDMLITLRTDPSKAIFESDCISAIAVDGQYPPTDYCGGAGNYTPHMYKLRVFYSNAGLEIPEDMTNLNEYRSEYFSWTPYENHLPADGFFGYGRYVTYKTHGIDWPTVPPDFMPHDFHDPIGSFDLITEDGIAVGWACDWDTAEIREQGIVKGLRVDFYVDGNPFTIVAFGDANSFSEPLVNVNCPNATGAYRFNIPLPPSTKGKLIHAFALDYTWYGHLQLQSRSW